MKGYCIDCIGASIGTGAVAACAAGTGIGAVRVAGAARVAPGVMGSETVLVKVKCWCLGALLWKTMLLWGVEYCRYPKKIGIAQGLLCCSRRILPQFRSQTTFALCPVLPCPVPSPPRPQSMALGQCSVDSPGNHRQQQLYTWCCKHRWSLASPKNCLAMSNGVVVTRSRIWKSISHAIYSFSGDFQLNSHFLSCTKSKQTATSMSPPQSEVQDSCVIAELHVILSPHI